MLVVVVFADSFDLVELLLDACCVRVRLASRLGLVRAQALPPVRTQRGPTGPNQREASFPGRVASLKLCRA